MLGREGVMNREREVSGKLSLEQKVAQLFSVDLPSLLENGEFSVEKARKLIKRMTNLAL